MLIGIDASRIATGEKTGTETYSYHLITNLERIDRDNKYILYFQKIPEVFQITNPNFSTRLIKSTRLWTQVGLSYECFVNPPDLLFIPAHTMPILRRPGLRTVVTIHDLGAEYLKEYHQFPQNLYLNFTTEYCARHATHLIAVSESTKRDLVKKLKADPKKISVVYEGVNREFFYRRTISEIENVKKKYGVAGSYILFVGTIQPRKNLIRLIEAFSKVHSETKNMLSLVLVGKPGWLYEEIYSAPKKFGVEDRVKFLNHVPLDDLPALYSGASLLALPSLYEGFGLPILEAFACETPVMTSKVSSMPEVAGEAAILVDPNKVEKIAQGIDQIITKDKLREQLIKKGLERVKEFSWEKTARETLEVFNKVMGDR